MIDCRGKVAKSLNNGVASPEGGHGGVPWSVSVFTVPIYRTVVSLNMESRYACRSSHSGCSRRCCRLGAMW